MYPLINFRVPLWFKIIVYPLLYIIEFYLRIYEFIKNLIKPKHKCIFCDNDLGDLNFVTGINKKYYFHSYCRDDFEEQYEAFKKEDIDYEK